jgi:mRNA interferase MazF
MDTTTKEILRVFVEWTKLKVQIHFSEIKAFPVKGEVWWASLGQNIGVEINGKNSDFERPVVVIKVFNNQGMLVAPISSKAKDDQYTIKFRNSESKINSINMSQIKSISSKRFLRKIGELDDETFEKLRKLYHSFV